jgi:hypothetical protein
MGKTKLVALAIGALVSITALAPSAPVALAAPADQAQTGVNEIGGNETGSNGSLLTIIHTIINVLLFLTGALAVIMLIYGGIQYVISRGDSAAVTSAKNTILYAVVGLIVAMVAYAVVNFIVSAFQPKPATPEPTFLPGTSRPR